VAETEPDPKRLPGGDELVDALSDAAGIPVLLDAVTDSYRREAHQSMGYPPARWWQRLRPDPLRELPSDPGAQEQSREPVRPATPEITVSQKARVDLAARAVINNVADLLPRWWADSLREVAGRPESDLSEALDDSVGGVDLTLRPPTWWQVTQGAQVALAGAAVIGFAWLAVLGVLAILGVDTATPSLGTVPLPTLLLLIGLIGGVVATLVVRRVIETDSQRHRAAVAARLHEAVQDVAWSHVIAPIAEVLTDHRTVRETLTSTL
jgi:hypothetical protein